MDTDRRQDQVSNEAVKPVRALLRDVAAAAHCDVSLVSRKRARGKSDAQIIREGMARWKRQQKAEALTAAKAESGATEIATVELPPDVGRLEAKAAADLSSLTYDEAQRLKEIELYRRQKLANDEAEGKLIDAGEVTTAWHEMVTTAKGRLLLIPDELGDRLASEANPIRCRELIREKIHHALEALAKAA